MKKVFSYLILLALIGMFLEDTSWSQRRRNRSEPTESMDDLIYNEKIDERSEEEKKSDTDRLIDAVKSIKQKERESAPGPSEEKERETQPGPDRPKEEPIKEPQSAPRAIRDDAPNATSGSLELENRPTLGIQVDSPDLLVDQQMLVQIRLNNSDRVPYTAVAYSLKYDPAVLEVIDQSEDLPGVNIRDASAADLGFALDPQNRTYVNTVDPSQGLISFMATLQADQNFSTKDGIIGEFTVRALRERGSTTLQFENVVKGIAIDAALEEIKKNKQTKPESLTFLRMLDQNNKEKVLEYAVLKFGAQIRVLPSSDRLLSGDEIAFYPTALRLIPSENQVQVGDYLDVFVLLDNSDQVTFDAISLYLRYDPRVLKVIDSDNNNWITEGINIHDGDYQKDFNLEYCRANRVDPNQGEIVYSMETFHEPISASGIFARIRFETIRPVRSTYILYGFNLPDRFPTTGIFRRKQDVLAGTNNPRDGIYSSPISIQPKF